MAVRSVDQLAYRMSWHVRAGCAQLLAPLQRGSGSGVALVVSALIILFLPLAFSSDLVRLAGWEITVPRALTVPTVAGAVVVWIPSVSTYLLPLLSIDMALYALILALILLAAWRNSLWRVRPWMFTAVVALTLALDVTDEQLAMNSSTPGTQPFPDLWMSSLFTVVLFMASRSLGIRSPDTTNGSRDHLRSPMALVTPLSVGTFFAYVGGSIWDFVSKEERIDKEYFAQVSQVIPLILLGIIVIHLQRVAKHVLGKTAITATVIILCFGEFLALTSLYMPAKRNPLCENPRIEPQDIAICQLDVMVDWYQYFAFVFSLQAACAALAFLLWALISLLGHDDSTSNVAR